MRKILLCVFCLLSMFFSDKIYAQIRTITGTVFQDSANIPISGASVKIKNTSRGVITNANGQFSIRASLGDVIVISAINFFTKEIQITESSNYNIRLSTNESALSDVVVTALGIKRQDRSLGYSVQTVSKDKLENARSVNVVDDIAGQVAGVRINQQSGALGGSSKIVIRGGSSLSGSSQPIFVIDGMIVENTSFTTGTSGNVDYGSGIGDINSDDIESMTVLKGPAATAQYGSLAKDGAIIITTKRGSQGQMRISINSSYQATSPLRLPDLQNEYAQGNYGLYNLRYTNGWGPKISDVQDQKYTDFLGRSVTLKDHPDNLKNFFVTGNNFINTVDLSGGDAKSDYRLSFGNITASGIVPEQSQNRYNFALNAGHKFSDKLSSRVTFNYVKNKVFGMPEQSSNSPNTLTPSVYGVPITVDMNDLRRNYQDSLGNQTFLSTDRNGNNPYWILNKNKHNSDEDRFYGTGNIEYKPLSWLTISDNLGFDISNILQHSFDRQGTAGDMLGSYDDYTLFQRYISNDLMITGQKDLTQDVNLKIMLGNSILDRRTSSTEINAQNLIIDNFYRPNNAQTVSTTQNFSQRRLISFYGEASASYKQMIYLTLTGRNDISSTLPLDNRSYFYPSIGGSFVFSELLNNKKVLSFGNIRLSYARVGSDANPYLLNGVYTAASTYFVQFSLPGNYPFLGQQGFTAPQVLPNADLKPQIARSYELGTNLKFLQNRIGVDFTYYHTRTTNQILNLAVPRSTGYFSKTINAGAITNSGYEVVLDLNIIKPVEVNGFNWDLTANFSHNSQIVNELAPGLSVYSVASGWSGLQIKAVPGKPFALYGTKWQRSPDGQIIIDPSNGLRLTQTDQYIGDVNPNYLLGISNSFSFKRFSLAFLIDIRQGGVFYSGTVASLRSTGMAKETELNRDATFVDKGVNAVTDNSGNVTYVTNKTPVQSMQDFWGNYSATANTEGNVFDASYIKLRSVSLSYSFPESALPKKVIKGLTLGVEGRNLWLIKSFVPHVDPELNFFGNGSAGDGVEFNSFPTTKAIGVNLKINF